MNAGLARVDKELRAQGVIAADAPSPPAVDGDRPWFIALLQGVAGWLAGIFLLVFIGFVLRPDERASILLLAAVLLGAAWAIYRLDQDGVFFDQFALALSIAGQFAVVWGLLEDHFHGLSASITVLLLQLGIWLVMPNRTARTLAALFGALAWAFAVRFMLFDSGSEYDLFGVGRRREPSVWSVPMGWLLTWAPQLGALWWLLQNEPRWMAGSQTQRLRPALTGLIMSIAMAGIAADPLALLFLGAGQMGLAFSWWAVFPLLSIGLALFAGYAAFRLRNTALLGFAIFAALLHLSRFYYLYGVTLLWKSVIMLSVGTGLLVLGEWLRRREAQRAS